MLVLVLKVQFGTKFPVGRAAHFSLGNIRRFGDNSWGILGEGGVGGGGAAQQGCDVTPALWFLLDYIVSCKNAISFRGTDLWRSTVKPGTPQAPP